MLSHEQVEQVVADHVDLLPMSREAMAQNIERSMKFLSVCAVLATYRRQKELERISLSSLSEATYHQAFKTATGKGISVTESKTVAAASPDHRKHREKIEEIDAEVEWIKAHVKIFENAHIQYRQISNGWSAGA